MEFSSKFFHNRDFPVAGPPRDITGYGEHPPRVRWENDAKVAVQIVVNYEEGSEKTFAMGDGENDILYELLLKLGLDLCVPIETKIIAKKTVQSIGAGVN